MQTIKSIAAMRCVFNSKAKYEEKNIEIWIHSDCYYVFLLPLGYYYALSLSLIEVLKRILLTKQSINMQQTRMLINVHQKRREKRTIAANI